VICWTRPEKTLYLDVDVFSEPGTSIGLNEAAPFISVLINRFRTKINTKFKSVDLKLTEFDIHHRVSFLMEDRCSAIVIFGLKQIFYKTSNEALP